MQYIYLCTVNNSSITTKHFLPYFDVSISSRDLHQKKLVLSSSDSSCDNQLSHQESVVGVTQLITASALVSIHSSMTFLADMYSFLDPPGGTVL